MVKDVECKVCRHVVPIHTTNDSVYKRTVNMEGGYGYDFWKEYQCKDGCIDRPDCDCGFCHERRQRRLEEAS